MIQHRESHRSHRVGWLRASVLGANDGIVSTASLMLGVAATGTDTAQVWAAGVAALVAGAVSMAAGEYVSVSAQADTEAADLAREAHELATDVAHEHAELAAIYVARGLDATLAQAVAKQMMAHDALGAHARDELGITETLAAQPLQAALSSAAAFALGAALPLAVSVLSPWLMPHVPMLWPTALCTLLFLALLGAWAARVGGAPVARSTRRVLLWGISALSITWAAGWLVGQAL